MIGRSFIGILAIVSSMTVSARPAGAEIAFVDVVFVGGGTFGSIEWLPGSFISIEVQGDIDKSDKEWVPNNFASWGENGAAARSGGSIIDPSLPQFSCDVTVSAAIKSGTIELTESSSVSGSGNVFSASGASLTNQVEFLFELFEDSVLLVSGEGSWDVVPVSQGASIDGDLYRAGVYRFAAFGFLAGSSLNQDFSSSITTILEWRRTCEADLEPDGAVGFADLLRLLEAWGLDDPALDLDLSGAVDLGDVILLLSSWGQC